MGRPKKEIGTARSIICAYCEKESKEGYRVQLSVHRAEITPNLFIAYDTDVMDYDSFLCSIDCIFNFIKQELEEEERNVRGNESKEEGRRGGPTEGNGGRG